MTIPNITRKEVLTVISALRNIQLTISPGLDTDLLHSFYVLTLFFLRIISSPEMTIGAEADGE